MSSEDESTPQPPRPGSSPLAAHIALAVVQVCFALFPIFGKWAFQPKAFTPLGIGAWRMLFAAASLMIAALCVHGRRALPEKRDLPLLAVCAFLGVALNMTLYLEGLKRSTAGNAGLVMCLIPVFTFAIAGLARQETFSPLRAVGIAVALAGASLLIWAERADLVRAHSFGNLLMAVNTLSYACYLVLSRPLTRRYPPLVVIAWVFALSVPWVPLIVARAMGGDGGQAIESWTRVFWPAAAPAQAWWSMAVILVFPTSLAYFLNAFALSRVRASTTAVFVYVQPVITGLAGWLLLGEELTLAMFASAGCVFTGIYLVARAPRSTAIAAEST